MEVATVELGKTSSLFNKSAALAELRNAREMKTTLRRGSRALGEVLEKRLGQDGKGPG